MKRLLVSLLFLATALISCKKDKEQENLPDNSFEAKINGQLIKFSVQSAVFYATSFQGARSFYIHATSQDSVTKVSLMFSDKGSTDSTMTPKTYVLRVWNEDNTNTPEDESVDSPDGRTTYIKKRDDNAYGIWVCAETGTYTLSSFDAGTRKASGTFNVSLLDMRDRVTKIEITEGKFNNVTYQIQK